MRPKETYTKEEYNELKKKLLIMADKYNYLKREYDVAIDFLKYFDKYRNGAMLSEIQEIIKKENERRKINELYIKYPYYKEIKEYINLGITEVKLIVALTGKSKSSVYRAMHIMGLI